MGGRTDWAGRQMESGCGGRGRSLGCSSGECGFVISLIEIRNKWEGAGVQGSRKMSLIWDFRGRREQPTPRGGLGSKGEFQAGDKDLKIICGGTGQRGMRCPKMGRESLRQGPWPITLGRKPWNLQILILPLLSRVNSGECELSGSHLPDCKWGERAPHRHWLPLGQ